MLFISSLSIILASANIALSSASSIPHIQRQATDIDPRIPSSCITPCTPAFPLYDACLYKRPGCEAVCWPENWSNFLSCQQCLLDASDHVIKGQVDSANNVLKQLSEDCATNGTAVQGNTVTANTVAISTAPRPSATEINPQNNNFAVNQAKPSSAANAVLAQPLLSGSGVVLSALSFVMAVFA